MKSYRMTCLLVLLFLVPAFLFSQTTESGQVAVEKEKRNSLTLDVTGLLHQFTNVSVNSPNYNSPYFLIFHRYGQKNALRLSLGGMNNGTVTNPGNTLENTSSYFNMAVGVGMDRFRDIGKKFNANYGAEIGFQFSDTKTRYEPSVSTYTENQTSTGAVILSPFLGLFWNLHPRLAIGTETSIRWGFYNSEIRSKSESSNTKSEEMRFVSSFHLPVNLMVRMRF